MDVDAATQTMIDNLPDKTGRSLAEWFEVLDGSGHDRHRAALDFLKAEHGVSHGYANLIVTLHRSRGADTEPEDLIAAQYAGRKAGLRPIYERLVEAATRLGPDVAVAPKKTGVSLRRAKQFALIEAPSAARVSLGLNLRGEPATARLRAARGMCTHRVDLTSVDDVDPEVLGWLGLAYDRAG